MKSFNHNLLEIASNVFLFSMLLLLYLGDPDYLSSPTMLTLSILVGVMYLVVAGAVYNNARYIARIVDGKDVLHAYDNDIEAFNKKVNTLIVPINKETRESGGHPFEITFDVLRKYNGIEYHILQVTAAALFCLFAVTGLYIAAGAIAVQYITIYFCVDFLRERIDRIQALSEL